jgi:undecaprenyl-diphosphatase
MDELIKLTAKYLILLPVAVNLYIFWRLNKKDRRTMLLILAAGGILSLVLAKLGSHLYDSPRPPFNDGSMPLFPHKDDNGFPSDHTLLASFLALVALAYSRKLGLTLLAAAALIAWARVAAHVHHLTDILGSFIITALAYIVVSNLIARLYENRRQPK